MKSFPKKILTITGLTIAFVAVVIMCITLLVDINSYKPRIEAALWEATGLNVKLNGKIGISFFPLGISAGDIHVTEKDSEILALKTLKLGVAFWPLLKKQINITSCKLIDPTLTISRDAAGTYNFETPERKSSKGGMGAAALLKEIKVSHGTLVYLDQKTGEETALKDINLAIGNLRIANASGNLMKNISFTGSVDCGEIKKKLFKIENFQSSIEAANGLIHFNPLSMDVFGAKGGGALTVDVSGTDTVYAIDLKVPSLDFAELQKSFGKKKMIGGRGDLYASLTMQKKGRGDLVHGAKGTFSLEGKKLVYYAMDLDKILSSYKSSREANLANIGALFIAGPLSTAALEAYRHVDAYYEARKGQTNITKFVAKWTIRDGMADAVDCALATRKNRIAAKGKLNLVSEQYENLTVALVDRKGCAKLKQTINGPFKSPRISTMSALQLLGSSIVNLFSEARDLVQGGDCEVFYSGSVGPP